MYLMYKLLHTYIRKGVINSLVRDEFCSKVNVRIQINKIKNSFYYPT